MRTLFAFVFGAIMVGSPAAFAQGAKMDVAPTTLQLESGKSGLVFITNHGDKAMRVQIEALDWAQDNNADRLTPSRSLFASPPMVEIAPRGRQTVRVMAAPRPPGSEATYRLMVSEMPDAKQEGGVKVLLQFNVPVFVGAQAKTAPLLAWSVRRGSAGPELVVRNDGAFTAKCVNVSLTRNGKTVPFDAGAIFYVLPQAERRFALPADAAEGVIRVSGTDQRSGQDFAADLSPRS